MNRKKCFCAKGTLLLRQTSRLDCTKTYWCRSTILPTTEANPRPLASDLSAAPLINRFNNRFHCCLCSDWCFDSRSYCSEIWRCRPTQVGFRILDWEGPILLIHRWLCRPSTTVEWDNRPCTKQESPDANHLVDLDKIAYIQLGSSVFCRILIFHFGSRRRLTDDILLRSSVVSWCLEAGQIVRRRSVNSTNSFVRSKYYTSIFWFYLMT